MVVLVKVVWQKYMGQAKWVNTKWGHTDKHTRVSIERLGLKLTFGIYRHIRNIYDRPP
jgi:hypothetical protein